MSTLLEQASLVLIPSGYKEDVVYSQIPTDGSGDLSFTRASNGTRINSAGLVEVCPWNLVTYSEQFDNAAWIKFDASATANATTAPNETTTADKFVEGTGSSIHRFMQGGAIDDGQSYTFSIYAKASERTRILLRRYDGTNDIDTYFDLTNGTIVSGTGTIANVGNGWLKCSITLTATRSFTSDFICQLLLVNTGTNTSYTGDGTSGLFVWGAQLNIGSTAKPYFPTTDRLNVPRLTYQNGGGGCPSLLLEKQSTNLLTYSEQMDNGAYGKGDGIAITANATTSPDGTQNADKIYTNTTTNGDHYFNRNPFTIISSSTAYTYSIFAKKAEFRYISVESTIQGGNYKFAIIDLTNGTIDSSDYAVTPKVEDYGNGWYRISVFGTSGASQTSADTYIIVMNDSKNRFYTGNGVSGIYTWGWQLEALSYQTSYIPTTSSSATRVADACFKTGISSLIGQTEGTIFCDVNLKVRTAFSYFAINYGGSSSQYIGIYFRTNGIELEVVDTTLQTSIVLTNTSTGRFKVAAAYKANDVALYINGVQVGTDTGANIPACDRLDLFAYGQEQPLEYNEAVLFKTRLTNAELASLTTI